MSNSNLTNSINRHRYAGEKDSFHVNEVLGPVINLLEENDQMKSGHLARAGKAALKTMEPEEAEYIRKQVRKFSNSQYKKADVVNIKNFGEFSAIELLIKLGIWLKEVEHENRL